ncbi:MAG: hypothetical protein WCT04_24340 [Planctomycetota bacterium]
MKFDALKCSIDEQLQYAKKAHESIVSDSLEGPLDASGQASLDQAAQRVLNLDAQLRVLNARKIPDAENDLMNAIRAAAGQELDTTHAQLLALNTQKADALIEFLQGLAQAGAALKKIGLSDAMSMNYPAAVLKSSQAFYDAYAFDFNRIVPAQKRLELDVHFTEADAVCREFRSQSNQVNQALEQLKSGEWVKATRETCFDAVKTWQQTRDANAPVAVESNQKTGFDLPPSEDVYEHVSPRRRK